MGAPPGERASLSEYLGELVANWRVLLAASLGTSVGLQLFSYVTGLFGPYLLREFRWSKSQFALVGLTMFSTLLVMPLAGRLTDRYGARRMALIGVALTPFPLIGYSLMQGPFWMYLACSAAQLAVGTLTGPITYTRLIAAHFTKARGLALTLVMCSPAVLAFALAPQVSAVIEQVGWRIGYRAIAAFVLVVGLLAIALIPSGAAEARREHIGGKADRMGEVFGEIRREPAFWVIFVGMVLITLPTPLHGSQFGILIAAQGLGPRDAGVMLSIYAAGTIVGRVGSGLALDWFSPRIVASLSMVLPAVGLSLIGSPIDTALAVGTGLFLVGVMIGAEGDLLSFLVARYFRLEVFSTVLSFAYCGVFLGSAIGAVLLSRMLAMFGSRFEPFLFTAAALTFIGALLFLLLPGRTRADSAAPPEPASVETAHA